MKKRVFAVLTAIFLLCACLPLSAVSVSALTYGPLTYTIENGEAIIVECNRNATGEIEIPAMLNGCPVTTIGEGAFNPCKNITSIILPKSLKVIEKFVFDTKMSSIVIPEGVTSIGEGAFIRCGFLNTVILPDSVTELGPNVFWECTALKQLYIGSGLQDISERHFTYNPDNFIRYPRFYVSENNPYVSSLDGVLFNKEKTALLCYPSEGGGSYSIPDSVTTIESYAFLNCSLGSITIPDSVVLIKGGAFKGCRYLSSLIIPDSVYRIQSEAFRRCSSLDVLKIGANAQFDGEEILKECTELSTIEVDEANAYLSAENSVLFNKDKTELIWYASDKENTSYTIPNYVKKIYPETFREAKNITKIVFEDGITTIEENVFADCESLLSVTFPNSVITIKPNAFANCEQLTDVYYIGTEQDKQNISFGEGNLAIYSANWHFSPVEEIIESTKKETDKPKNETDKPKNDNNDTMLFVLGILIVVLLMLTGTLFYKKKDMKPHQDPETSE